MESERTRVNNLNINKIRKKIITNTFVIILFLILSIFLYMKGKSSLTANRLFYNETSNLDYLVFLKENDFYKEKFLKKDKRYIANLIDYIEAEYKYTFTSSDTFNYTYKYYITAQIIANEKGDATKVLYNQEETIVPEEKFTLDNSNSFVISGDFKIDYQKYNELITIYKRTYTLSIDSKLIVSLHIAIDGKYDELTDKVIIDRDLSMTLPLSEQTIGINIDYKEIKDSNVIEEKTNKNNTSTLFYTSSIASLVCTFVFIYFGSKSVHRLMLFKSKYIREYNKIMKEYNQIIVKAKKLPQINNMEIIETETFQELLDVRESIQKPILHIEVVPKEISWFIILNQEETYRYILESKE